ncbi:MAG: hypothetical protein IKJ88_08720 [Clostridia bacterium]|nr:hypothetical protein [Clostridia bacterium]
MNEAADIFLKIVNMSISAGWIVLIVLLMRFLLKKAPKWINVLLWSIVAIRLICPFTIESMLSLIPSAETVSPEIMISKSPEINSGVPIINSVVNPVINELYAPEPSASANPLQILIPVAAALWLVGIAALLIYTLVSFLRLKSKIGTAVLLKENIYQSENISSPFVLGIIKPKIYLPFYMNERDIPPVVAHEKAHIQRKDYLWKPLGFLILTLHWFNPLVWLGYVLLCRDIELACDEKVVKTLSNEQRANYSEALLTCSVNRRMIAACPLAFGEVGVKDRVKSILNYKKPAFWVIVIALILCIALAIGFLTNPVNLYVYNSRYETGKCLYSYVVSADKETENNELVFDITSDGKVYKTFGDGTTDELGVLKESDYTSDDLKEAMKNQDMKLSIGNIKNAYELSNYIFLQKSNGTVYLVSLFSDGKIMSVFKLKRTGECDSSKSDFEKFTWNYQPMLSHTSYSFYAFAFDTGYSHIVASCDNGKMKNLEADKQPEDKTLRFEKGQHVYWTPDEGIIENIPLVSKVTFTVFNGDEEIYTSTVIFECLSRDMASAEFAIYLAQSDGLRLFEKDGALYFAENASPDGGADENTSTDIDILKAKYPHFFDISTDGGLTVYVWQMAEENYRCYLANTFMEAISDNSFIYTTADSASPDEMRAILSDYAVDQKDITVQGIINPLSSYYYELDEAYQRKVKALFSDVKLQQEFEATISYANYAEYDKLFADALNRDDLNSNLFLPLYCFDTLNDLEQFKEIYGNILTMDSGYDEIPSFNDATSKYDSAFFEENSLVLVYVTAGSGTFRFGVESVGYDENFFGVYIEQTNNPEVYTMDMAGWFITLAVPDALLENCHEFVAVLVNTSGVYDGKNIPKLTVQYGAVKTDAVAGTLTWTSEAENGTMQTVNADSSHPTALMEHLLPLALKVNTSAKNEPVAQLHFDNPPNKISVNGWYVYGDGKTKEFDVQTDSLNVLLNDTKETAVYEVVATWNSFEKYYGTVRYSFCVVPSTNDYENYIQYGNNNQYIFIHKDTAFGSFDNPYKVGDTVRLRHSDTISASQANNFAVYDYNVTLEDVINGENAKNLLKRNCTNLEECAQFLEETDLYLVKIKLEMNERSDIKEHFPTNYFVNAIGSDGKHTGFDCILEHSQYPLEDGWFPIFVEKGANIRLGFWLGEWLGAPGQLATVYFDLGKENGEYVRYGSDMQYIILHKDNAYGSFEQPYSIGQSVRLRHSDISTRGNTDPHNNAIYDYNVTVEKVLTGDTAKQFVKENCTNFDEEEFLFEDNELYLARVNIEYNPESEISNHTPVDIYMSAVDSEGNYVATENRLDFSDYRNRTENSELRNWYAVFVPKGTNARLAFVIGSPVEYPGPLAAVLFGMNSEKTDIVNSSQFVESSAAAYYNLLYSDNSDLATAIKQITKQTSDKALLRNEVSAALGKIKELLPDTFSEALKEYMAAKLFYYSVGLVLNDEYGQITSSDFVVAEQKEVNGYLVCKVNCTVNYRTAKHGSEAFTASKSREQFQIVVKNTENPVVIDCYNEGKTSSFDMSIRTYGLDLYESKNWLDKTDKNTLNEKLTDLCVKSFEAFVLLQQ